LIAPCLCYEQSMKPFAIDALSALLLAVVFQGSNAASVLGGALRHSRLVGIGGPSWQVDDHVPFANEAHVSAVHTKNDSNDVFSAQLPNGLVMGAAISFIVFCVTVGSGACLAHSSVKDASPAAARASTFALLIPAMSAFQFTVAIPESYSIARQLGHQATFSGWIISVYQVGVFAGVGMTWCWFQCHTNAVQKSKYAISCGCFFLLLGTLTCMLTLVSLKSIQDRVHPLMLSALVLGGRICQGLGEGLMNFTADMTLQCLTPRDRMTRIFSCGAVLQMCGLGLGPMLSSLTGFTCSALEGGSGNSAASNSIFQVLVACGWSIAVLCMYPATGELEHNLEVPLSEQQKEAARVHTEQTSTPQVICDHGAMQGVEQTCRARIVVLTVETVNFLRCVLISALECASVLILEVQFGFTTSEAGFLTTAPLFAALPAYFLYTHFREVLREESAVRCLILAVVLGSFGIVDLASNSRANLILLLVGDGLGLPSLPLVRGILRGIQLQFVEEGGFTKSNLLILSSLLGSLARTLGPPSARYLIEHLGRNTYAAAQFGGSLVFILILELCLFPTLASKGQHFSIHTSSRSPCDRSSNKGQHSSKLTS